MAPFVYEYTLPLALSGKPEEVFEALVDEKALQTWFSEYAEIEPREGGAYRFWGKYSLDPKTRDKADQKITAFKPGEQLSFTWRFLARDGEVTWELAPAEEKGETTLTIKHRLESLPEIGRAKELVDDMWRLITGNLCFYMMGERKIFRPDFDDPNPEVVHEIIIRAPRAKVFKALIEPDYIKQWFPAPEPLVEPRVGGKYGFGFSYEKDGKTITAPPMEILEFQKDRKLVITWPDWRGDASVPDQKLAWFLEDHKDGTKLRLVHSGFSRAVDVSDYPFGWVEFIRKIGEVAEGI